MKLNIKNRNKYNENTQQAIREYEDDVLVKMNTGDNDDAINAAKMIIEAIDKYIELVNLEKDECVESFEMCTLSTIQVMISEKIDTYKEEIPNKLKTILERLIDKMQ